MINISKPFMPPQKEYQDMISSIWQTNWLTNHGPLLQQFEKKISTYCKVKNFHFVANGTIALQIALRSLNIKGDVITSPFSFVATTNAILWEKCNPVFVDISSSDFNIDSGLIEKAITKKTVAILVPHVYGNPCDIEKISIIADQYNLKVIFDAAHCFGTSYKGKSIYEYGDASIASFHATKLFHTVEGGGLFFREKVHSEKAIQYSNFGFDSDPNKFTCAGINAKNSEFHAAMGLCNLKYIDEILRKRKQQWNRFNNSLKGHYSLLEINKHSNYNYAYFPLLFKSEEELQLYDLKLRTNSINVRRYFYPALNKLDYLNYRSAPITEDISSRVICLPLFHSLEEVEQDKIIDILLS